MFHVFAALAEFIREIIVSGTREGLAAARARGRVGGRPTVVTPEIIRAARDMLPNPDASITAIARLLGVSPGTLYNHILTYGNYAPAAASSEPCRPGSQRAHRLARTEAKAEAGRVGRTADRVPPGSRPMQPTTAADLTALLAGDAVAGADRPLLTYYDDATGERTELTAAALGGWAVRTAGLAPVGRGTDEPMEAVFVARKRLGSWMEVVLEARHRSCSTSPPTARCWTRCPPAIGITLPRSAGTPTAFRRTNRCGAPTRRAPMARATRSGGSWRAASLDLRAGDRLLVDVAEHEEPVKWLLAPLAAGASVVLCANLDRSAVDARIAAEGVTRVL